MRWIFSWGELTPRNQQQYQVRFDGGVDGGNALAPGADILIWVDASREGAESADFDILREFSVRA